MRRTLLVLAWTLGASSMEAQFAKARVWLPGFPTQMALDTIGTIYQVNAPEGKTFRAVVSAFEELKIPLDMRDSLHGMVGNMTLKLSHSMAGSQMSRWFSCGSGMTGPNADSWRMQIAIAALLDKITADSTRLRIGMAAGAQDMQGNAKEPVACATSGALEARIVEIVNARVRAP